MKRPAVYAKVRGFTLIELMVVLVVIAVLIGAATQAFRFGGGDHLRAEAAKIRGLLVTLSDQSSFQGKTFLLTPAEKGLEAWQLEKGEWQVANQIAEHQWLEEFEYRWQVDERLKPRWKLPAEGWLFWPSGEVTEGTIEIASKTDKHEDGDPLVRWLEWNSVLTFAEDE